MFSGFCQTDTELFWDEECVVWLVSLACYGSHAHLEKELCCYLISRELFTINGS